MKKLFSILAACLCVSSMWATPTQVEFAFTTAENGITITSAGQADPGSATEVSKGNVTVTSTNGRAVAGSALQIFKTKSMVVTVPNTYEITSIAFTYPTNCYPFKEAIPTGLTNATTKTESGKTTATFTPATPAASFTFTNIAGGQTKVNKMVVTYDLAGQGGNQGGDQGGDQGGGQGGNSVLSSKTCALVAVYSGAYYAAGVNIASSKAPKFVVDVINGVAYVDNEGDKDAIAWDIKEYSSGYTISPSGANTYLSATNSNADLSLVQSACYWNKKEDNGNESYWISKSDNKYYRTLTYQEGSTKAFKAYTASNIGASNYATTAAYAMPIVVCPNAMTLGNGGYSTYCAPYNYTISGATAYKVASQAGVTVTLEAITEGAVIAAGQGVILKGDQGDNITIAKSAETATVTATGLVGTVVPTVQESGFTYYGIATKDGETGFYPAASNLVLPAVKAFLKVSNTLAPARFEIVEVQNPVATGVENVATVKATKALVNGQLVIVRNGAKFNLNGMLVK